MSEIPKNEIKKEQELKLQTPINRGTKKIDSVVLRKPAAGELRGLKMNAILDGDYDTLVILIPRISSPSLTSDEISKMDVADLFDANLIISSFHSKKVYSATM